MNTTENKQNILTPRNLSELHASKGLFEIKDNRISQQKVAQLKTEIHYTPGPLADTGFTVGKQMYAFLDPNDPVHGSEPGEQIGLIKRLKEDGYRAMVRGHLLNAELGGLGIAANLYPITSQANSLHKTKVENHVKKNIASPQTNQIDENNRLKYEVTVDEQEFPEATFRCQLSTEKGIDILRADINSKPQQNSKGSGSVAPPNTPSLTFKNSNLGQGWGHVGRGYNSEIHSDTHDRTEVSSIPKVTVKNDETIDENFHEFRNRQFLYELWESSDMTVKEFMNSIQWYNGNIQGILVNCLYVLIAINYPNAYAVEYANEEEIENFFFNNNNKLDSLLEFLNFFGIDEANSFF